LRTAVAIEPNCAPAWLEIGLANAQRGELTAAHKALGQIEAVLALAANRPPASGYERGLVAVDPGGLAFLRSVTGGGR
jgi:hypothetical protein